MSVDYQELIAEQRDGYLIALEVLTQHTSTAAIKRAIKQLRTDRYWRDGNESRCDFAATELAALLESR